MVERRVGFLRENGQGESWATIAAEWPLFVGKDDGWKPAVVVGVSMSQTWPISVSRLQSYLLHLNFHMIILTLRSGLGSPVTQGVRPDASFLSPQIKTPLSLYDLAPLARQIAFCSPTWLYWCSCFCRMACCPISQLSSLACGLEMVEDRFVVIRGCCGICRSIGRCVG